jgi:hypothetical protein
MQFRSYVPKLLSAREDEMRKEDLFQKNHFLGVEFDRYLLEHPEMLEQIPENAEIYFLPEENPELSQENIEIARAQKAAGSFWM